MKIKLTVLVLLFATELPAQVGTFTDKRDGNRYQTIIIGNKIWFRENLRYITPLSYFPNFKSDTLDLRYGNYYAHTEMNTVCPPGWYVPSVDDFGDYLRSVASLNNIPDSAITRSTQKNKDSSMHILIGSLHPLDDTLLKFEKIGWVEGRKVENKKSVTIWLTDNKTNDDKFHTHIGAMGYIIHTHIHNVIDKPRRTRKFTVRCICELRTVGNE